MIFQTYYDLDVIDTIVLDMIPPTATAQEKGINRKTGKIYSKPAAAAARAKLRAYLSKHVPAEPIAKKAIGLYVLWRFPITGKHHNGEPMITRPDTDNLNKALKDVMTELGFWDDDSRITNEYINKAYALNPGVTISYGLIKEPDSEPEYDLYAEGVDDEEDRC